MKESFKMKKIVFDTNALLDLHKYTYGTLSKILDELEDSTKYEIVILDRVYFEYCKNVKRIVNKPLEKHPILNYKDNLKKSLCEIKKRIRNLHLNYLSKTFDTEVDSLIDSFISNELKKFEQDLNKEIKNVESNVTIDKTKNNQRIQSFVEHFYPKNRKWSCSKWLKQVPEIKNRIDLKIPPYDPIDNVKDNVKDDVQDDYFARYGDFLVWYEFLENIANTNVNEVLFIENEKKVAFWENNNYKEFFPYLINEVSEICPNVKFTPMSFEGLILSMQHEFEVSVIQEVNSLREEIENIYKNDEYIENSIDFLAIPDLDNQINDILEKSVCGGNIDEVFDINFLSYEIEFKRKKVKIDSPNFGVIAVEVPVKYNANVEVSIYYGTGEDYMPFVRDGIISFRYDILLCFDYYVNENGKINMTANSGACIFRDILIDEDSFESNESYDEYDCEDLNMKCEGCGTPLDDDNRSLQDPKYCCDCITSINKILGE